MNDMPLVVAVPSKGRLQENAFAFFRRGGLDLVQPRGARDYRGTIAGIDGVDVLFVSAAEITTQICQGAVHLGVTGEDLLREALPDGDSSVELIAPLGFGQADVVVAVPKAWIDVASMADLDDVAADLHHRQGRRLRVATKYVNLARRFFARHNIVDYLIVESTGATEGAPAAGTAEIIVDITTTGSTLAANGLKVLEDGVILRSEAHLAASFRAPWQPTARRAARRILARIAAAERARMIREIRCATAAVPPQTLTEILDRHGASFPLAPAGNAAAVVHCPVRNAEPLAEALIAAGAGPVTVGRLDFVFHGDDALNARLDARLGAESVATG